MTNRATFTLDPEAYAFLNDAAGSNKSAFVNKLLRQEKDRMLQDAIIKANEEEANDMEYQAHLAEWDVASADGLDSNV